jgi:hypothetical protein
VVYDRDVVTGHLDVVTIEQVGGKLDAALGPDGAHVYVGSKTMVVFELETFSCSPTPAAGCRPPAAPLRSAVSIKDDDDPGDDKFNWKSRPAGITAIADFGDPAGDDHVAFCVYDASASPQPVMEAVAPAGSTCALEPCWDLSRPTQLKYVDSSRLPDGVEKITARQRLADRGNLKVKGKGYAVRVPALPLTTPVRVQLQSRTGACWEATFSAPKKNDAVTFAGKSD